MTERARVEALAVMSLAHDLLACRREGCPRCRAYYALLLTRTT